MTDQDNLFNVIYHDLSSEELDLIKHIKHTARSLALLYAKIKNREMSVAFTNLEQSVMWAVKAVCVEHPSE